MKSIKSSVIEKDGYYVGVVYLKDVVHACTVPCLEEANCLEDLRKKHQHQTPPDAFANNVGRIIIDITNGSEEAWKEGLKLKLAVNSPVLTELRKTKFGVTLSYSELAKLAFGKEGAARAVGNAMKKNPIPVLIPCHRVIKKDGKLGRYSGRGSEKKKRDLIEIEKKESNSKKIKKSMDSLNSY